MQYRRLFKPYSQADKSIQTKYGGTGLGFWISQKLVSLMNGRISVASELNKGTVFIIEIPVQAEILESSSSEEVNLLVGSEKGSISTNQMPF
jgi:signal transduction histidine kinase